MLPWQRAGWEHSFERVAQGRAWECQLRSARIRAVGSPLVTGETDESRHRAQTVRQALARAVWVEIKGRAQASGEGVLQLSVCPLGLSLSHEALNGVGVTEQFQIRVLAERHKDVVSAWLVWTSPLQECAPAVWRALDGFSRMIAALPQGARVMLAMGTSLDELYLRKGYVMLGPNGLVGDACWQALARRLDDGALEQLVLRCPERVCTSDQVLDVVIAQQTRFEPGPVEMALHVGRRWIPDAKINALIAGFETVLHDANPTHGSVTEHDWNPLLLEQTFCKVLHGSHNFPRND